MKPEQLQEYTFQQATIQNAKIQLIKAPVSTNLPPTETIPSLYFEVHEPQTQKTTRFEVTWPTDKILNNLQTFQHKCSKGPQTFKIKHFNSTQKSQQSLSFEWIRPSLLRLPSRPNLKNAAPPTNPSHSPLKSQDVYSFDFPFSNSSFSCSGKNFIRTFAQLCAGWSRASAPEQTWEETQRTVTIHPNGNESKKLLSRLQKTSDAPTSCQLRKTDDKAMPYYINPGNISVSEDGHTFATTVPINQLFPQRHLTIPPEKDSYESVTIQSHLDNMTIHAYELKFNQKEGREAQASSSGNQKVHAGINQQELYERIAQCLPFNDTKHALDMEKLFQQGYPPAILKSTDRMHWQELAPGDFCSKEPLPIILSTPFDNAQQREYGELHQQATEPNGETTYIRTWRAHFPQSIQGETARFWVSMGSDPTLQLDPFLRLTPPYSTTFGMMDPERAEKKTPSHIEMKGTEIRVYLAPIENGLETPRLSREIRQLADDAANYIDSLHQHRFLSQSPTAEFLHVFPPQKPEWRKNAEEAGAWKEFGNFVQMEKEVLSFLAFDHPATNAPSTAQPIKGTFVPESMNAKRTEFRLKTAPETEKRIVISPRGLNAAQVAKLLTADSVTLTNNSNAGIFIEASKKTDPSQNLNREIEQSVENDKVPSNISQRGTGVFFTVSDQQQPHLENYHKEPFEIGLIARNIQDNSVTVDGVKVGRLGSVTPPGKDASEIRKQLYDEKGWVSPERLSGLFRPSQPKMPLDRNDCALVRKNQQGKYVIENYDGSILSNAVNRNARNDTFSINGTEIGYAGSDRRRITGQTFPELIRPLYWNDKWVTSQEIEQCLNPTTKDPSVKPPRSPSPSPGFHR